MAISGGDVKFTFTGDASDLNKELTKVSGNLDGVVSSSQGAANDLDRKLGPAAKSAGNRIEGMSEQSGDADSILQGLAASLDMVNPALGDAARFAGDAAGGFEAVGRASFLLNPLFLAAAAAAAAVAFAFVQAAEAAEEAEEAVEAAAKAAAEAQKVYSSFTTAIDEAADAYRLQRGEVTELELAIRDATAAVEDQTEAGIKAARADVLRLEKKLRLMKEEPKLVRDGAAAMDAAVKSQHRVSEQLEKKKKQLAALEEQQNTALLQAEFVLEATAAQEAADEEAAENEKRRAAAEAARAQAKKEEDARLLALDKERAAFSDQIAKIQHDAAADQLSGREKILDSYQDELTALNKIMESESATAEQRIAAEVAQGEVRERIHRETAALEAELTADAIARDMARFEADAAALAERRDLTMGATTELVDAVGVLTDDIIDRQGEATGEAALTVFRINKAAALANVAIKAGEGMAVAAALPPPVDVIKGIAVGISTAAATAAIMAAQPPAFHGGAAPDEVNARLMQGEAVLNASAVSAVGGEDGINALNAGELLMANMMPGGMIALAFKHRLFDAVVKDNVRRTGSPLRQAIQGDRLIGQAAR